ncbi:MAG: hypothetical protein H6754_00815 [Candidatus Omnitrophica bacterium]|nr:hypothetical protein [Candidatus Omnitrophota bacterium]
MVMTDTELYEQKQKEKKLKSSIAGDLIRDQLIEHSKVFKTAWLNLGQGLYPVYKDKLFTAWGFEKFEHYTEGELGVNKETATKLLKTYFFLEQDEPDYLKKDFSVDRDPAQVPGYDALNVLRLARASKELNKDDYAQLKEAVFEKGREASEVRKDLTGIMKERKKVDPDEEREKRNTAALKKLINALHTFQKDMEALKLAPPSLVEEVNSLMKKLAEEVQ